ncbi:hypothetical protein T8K17_17585 [Thalassobaculum sp. OXR-137]|uniref:hypothetical protein n=1 Tax=Thalassobaculum sp. OXR-137 TaxID=3100173 RepID=UPI002AC92C5F|nr:hypothetical protein [Thalassobaculum sp. OXR-137]WPZ33047.1 hypothetical protein T8K17_17585 [Thalassobaculum sp. OXR-137]
MAAAAAAVAVLCLALPASAQTLTPDQTLATNQLPAGSVEPPSASWYVVGDFGRHDPGALDFNGGFDDRQTFTGGGVGLGVTFSNAEPDRTLSFTAPTMEGEAEDRFTFLVSGAYDWHTGTIVTPRFMAGVGVSYLDPNGAPVRMRQEIGAGADMTPTAQVGFGADVSISNSLDLSAEYRASVRGAGDSGGAEQTPQVSQKFMIGAKLRF